MDIFTGRDFSKLAPACLLSNSLPCLGEFDCNSEPLFTRSVECCVYAARKACTKTSLDDGCVTPSGVNEKSRDCLFTTPIITTTIHSSQSSREVNSSLLLDVRTESLFGAGSFNDESDETDSLQSPPFIRKIFSFSFLQWNINGLFSKLGDNDFVEFISSFGFVCLVETFTETFSGDIFPGHKAFCKPSMKLSSAGRPSGGVVCLIKNEFVPFIKEIKVDCGYFLLLINVCLVYLKMYSMCVRIYRLKVPIGLWIMREMVFLCWRIVWLIMPY